MEIVDASTIAQVIQALNLNNNAQIRRSSDLRPRQALRLILALDVAATVQNPFVLSNPFDGCFVSGATDASTTVQMSIGSADGYATDNPIPLTVNSSAKFDTTIKGGYLTWTAQPGKILTLIVLMGIDFRPGSFVTSFNGAVSVIGGTSVLTGTMQGSVASIAVTSASAVKILPQNLSRGEFDLYTDNDIWIGDASVAVGRGILIPAGSNFTFANTGSLYAIAAAGTANVTGMEQSN